MTSSLNAPRTASAENLRPESPGRKPTARERSEPRVGRGPIGLCPMGRGGACRPSLSKKLRSSARFPPLAIAALYALALAFGRGGHEPVVLMGEALQLHPGDVAQALVRVHQAVHQPFHPV